jgi:hypothetical protein
MRYIFSSSRRSDGITNSSSRGRRPFSFGIQVQVYKYDALLALLARLTVWPWSPGGGEPPFFRALSTPESKAHPLGHGPSILAMWAAESAGNPPPTPQSADPIPLIEQSFIIDNKYLIAVHNALRACHCPPALSKL